MKLNATEDVDAPMGVVWERFTDFLAFENEAQGRGADLTCVGDWSSAAPGAKWRGEIPVRGKKRLIEGEITQYAEGEICGVESHIGGMDYLYELSFVQLSPEATRVTVTLDLAAKTLSARLLLQTMKLARGRIQQKLQALLARQANAAEANWRKMQRAQGANG